MNLIDVVAHEIQTDHRAGRMLAATVASDKKNAKTVLTTDVHSASGARYHQTFELRGWTAQTGDRMLTVEVKGSGSWEQGIKPIKVFNLNTRTLSAVVANDSRNADKLLRYAAMCAVTYAWLGVDALPNPTNGYLTVVEAVICGSCGRKLFDPVSIARGVGPECYGKLTGTHTILSRAV